MVFRKPQTCVKEKNILLHPIVNSASRKWWLEEIRKNVFFHPMDTDEEADF
jgi:hypothetical protein